jgi:hypothetical protein
MGIDMREYPTRTAISDCNTRGIPDVREDVGYLNEPPKTLQLAVIREDRRALL